MAKYFTERERYKLETMLEDKIPVAQIAKRLGKCRQTIYNEIKRGKVEQMDTELVKHEVYKADYAQRDFESKQSAKGPAYKIGSDWELYNFIQDKVLKEKWSPAAIAGYIKLHNLTFSCSLCFKTIYNYIHAGLFTDLSSDNLIRYKKKAKKGFKKVALKNMKGTSIEERPEQVKERSSFGHWEMDCVIGKQEKDSVLLVLTERQTRFEIIRKIKDKTQKSVISALNSLEKKLGAPSFRDIFQSITMDNGSEFLNHDGIESSCLNSGRRTETYYCHPFASWERGSNECLNKMIRRWIPKGSPIGEYTKKYIKKISSWMNDFPRKIFGFCSSLEMLYESCPEYADILAGIN